MMSTVWRSVVSALVLSACGDALEDGGPTATTRIEVTPLPLGPACAAPRDWQRPVTTAELRPTDEAGFVDIALVWALPTRQPARARVADACFELGVERADGSVVWREGRLCSSEYGASGRDEVVLTYVGVCDSEADNAVVVRGVQACDRRGVTLERVALPCADGCRYPTACTTDEDTLVDIEL